MLEIWGCGLYTSAAYTRVNTEASTGSHTKDILTEAINHLVQPIVRSCKGSDIQSVRFTSTYILDVDTNLANSKHPTA